MGTKDKIVRALSLALQPEYVRLDNGDGISGFVVSRQFEDMSALDRQTKIDDVLRDALQSEERRQVLMIAGVTPAEYEAVGARIRIQKVKEMAGGAVEIILHGGLSDAQYVREALENQKDVKTTEPRQIAGALGILASFRAKGTKASPLTREMAVRILKGDRYIEVLSKD